MKLKPSFLTALLLSSWLLAPQVRAQSADDALSANTKEKVPTFTITAAVSPKGAGTVLGGGSKTNGQSVTLTAKTNAGYGFLFWTLDGTNVSSSSPYTFKAGTNNQTLVANFGYAVTTSSCPPNAGTTSGGGVFTNGASVILTANATNSCYNFANWEKGTRVASTSPTYTFTVASPEALVAHFTQIQDTIQTLSNPTYGGTTSGGGSKGCGTKVTVTAAAKPGFKFIGWSVNGAVGNRTNASYTFPAEGNETLTAEFSDIQAPTLAITSPKTGVKVNTSLLTITGTAKDNSGVACVFYALNGNPDSQAALLAATTNNYANWSASVILSPGTNLFYAFARGNFGPPSKTNSITIINEAAGQAPMSLAGLVAQFTKDTNPPVEINFGEATFVLFETDPNAGPGVANYTYTQTGPETAQLVPSFIEPPNKTDKTNMIHLTFTSPSCGTFSNTTDGTTGTITLSPGPDLELHSPAGATVVAVDSTTGATHTTTFGNGTFTATDSSGSYTSALYGPLAAMDCEIFNGGLGTHYNILLFTSSSNGTYFSTIYDGAGRGPYFSFGTFTITRGTSKTVYVAPEFLAGLSTEWMPHNKTASTVTFGQATFGQTSTSTNNNSVGDYTYTRLGTNTAQLVHNSISPPSASQYGTQTNLLTFKNSTSATFTNLDEGGYGTVTVLSQAANLAPAALSSNTIHVVFPTNSGSLSLDYGNYIARSSSGTNSGTCTYAPYSPTVGMLTTDQTEYFQLTFATAASGTITRTKDNGTVKIGTFTLK